jgi:hypothetical protein
MLRAVCLLVLAVCAAFVIGGCQPAQAPATTMMRTLEPRRALAVIEQAITDNGARPLPGRSLALRPGGKLQEAFAIAGGPYGIAYVTKEQADELGEALPRYLPDSDRLRLVRPAADAIVLLLYEEQYRYDVGEQHSATAVAAEMMLARDVADFILHKAKPQEPR